MGEILLYGCTDDNESLREVMRSIGRRYRDLRSLSTAYENKMDQQLSCMYIF